MQSKGTGAVITGGGGNVMTEAEIPVMCCEDGGRSHKKQEKSRKENFPSEPSEGTSPINTLTLAQ